MTNERQYINIKEWFYNKTEDAASRYNCFIDKFNKEENEGKDFVTVLAEEVISETDKAVQVRLSTGSAVGSVKGWKTWMPKSVIC